MLKDIAPFIKSLLIHGFQWPKEVSSSRSPKYKQKLSSSCHFHVSRCSVLRRVRKREHFGSLFYIWEEIFNRYSISVFIGTHSPLDLDAAPVSLYILKISKNCFSVCTFSVFLTYCSVCWSLELQLFMSHTHTHTHTHARTKQQQKHVSVGFNP